MRRGWSQAFRGALACLGLLILCAPVALATPDEPVAAGEIVAAPAADDSAGAAAADEIVAPTPAADDSAGVAAADGSSAADGSAAAADGSSVAAGNDSSAAAADGSAAAADDSSRAAAAAADESAAAADDSSRAAAADDSSGAADDSAPAAANGPVRAAAEASSWAAAAPAPRAAAQDPPPDEEEAPPAEPEPELPPTSDPSCVFPQFDPNDLQQCQVLASDCTVLGTPDADILVGEATADLICGLGGDDQIDGGEGDDSILGGDGNDRLTGGPGSDCLLGQGGDADEFVDAEDDLVVEDFESWDDPEGASTGVTIRRDGGCRPTAVLGESPGVQQSSGSVASTVEAAGVVYELAQLIDEASHEDEAGAAFPLDLPPTARAEDGVVRLLLDCEEARITGTLELLERRGDRAVRAGRAEFDCTPPSEVVEVELEQAAADRLEDRGRLAVTVRVDADDYSADRDFRLTIRSER